MEMENYGRLNNSRASKHCQALRFGPSIFRHCHFQPPF